MDYPRGEDSDSTVSWKYFMQGLIALKSIGDVLAAVGHGVT